jgi:hypothetical protein
VTKRGLGQEFCGFFLQQTLIGRTMDRDAPRLKQQGRCKWADAGQRDMVNTPAYAGQHFINATKIDQTPQRITARHLK